MTSPVIGVTTMRRKNQYGMQLASLAEAYVEALAQAEICPVLSVSTVPLQPLAGASLAQPTVLRASAMAAATVHAAPRNRHGAESLSPASMYMTRFPSGLGRTRRHGKSSGDA